MSRRLAEELGRLRVAREKEALAKGWRHVPDWMFCNEEGRPIWKSDLERRVFHRLLAKAGLRRIRFHDLRQSLAYVKEQMGHHSIKVTVDIYGKLVPGANKAAVDRLDADEDTVRRTQPSATPAQPAPRTKNPRGRAVPEPRGFKWWS